MHAPTIEMILTPIESPEIRNGKLAADKMIALAINCFFSPPTGRDDPSEIKFIIEAGLGTNFSSNTAFAIAALLDLSAISASELEASDSYDGNECSKIDSTHDAK